MRKFLIIIMIGCLPLFTQKAAAGTPVDEQEFVDFLATLPTLSSVKAEREKVDSIVDVLKGYPTELDKVLDWAAKYLLDKRSPIYNPQLYDSIFVLDSPGRTPLDFNFKDTTGRKSTLYTSCKGDTTVIFFYSPDCDHCTSRLKEWQEKPSTMPEVLRSGHVLAVCLIDDDDLWRKSIVLLPKNWTPVMDLDGLIARRRYDLRELPHISTLIPSSR